MASSGKAEARKAFIPSSNLGVAFFIFRGYDMEANQFWEQVKTELISVLPDNAHPWIYPLELSGYDKGVLTVVTGQAMGRDLLRKNHYRQIVDVIKKFQEIQILIL